MLKFRGKKYVLATVAEKAVERLLGAVLPDSPYAHHAFAVGGYVRDEVMGLDSKDLDIVVDVEGGAKGLTSYLHKLFPSATSSPCQLGQGYPITNSWMSGECLCPL